MVLTRHPASHTLGVTCLRQNSLSPPSAAEQQQRQQNHRRRGPHPREVAGAAVWASVAALSNRKRILRNILSVTLVLLVTATILTGDPGLAVLLMIPSSLLAIAAGVIFQGRGSQK